MSRTAKKAHPTSHQRRSTPKETAVVPKDLEVPLQVPPLTAYPSLKKVEVALVDDSVTVGENIQPARPIPDSFPSTKVYLKAMQAHTQREFEASIKAAKAEMKDKNSGGWIPVVRIERSSRDSPCISKYVVHGDAPHLKREKYDFDKDPWSKHAVQFEGEPFPAIALTCDIPEGKRKDWCILKVIRIRDTGECAQTIPGTRQQRIRSLGYVGSFLKQYGSAARLLKEPRCSYLVDFVAKPSGDDLYRKRLFSVGTFAPVDADAIESSQVPINSAQRTAVANLGGGIDIVVGPPGAGKSTTIWHVINSRIASSVRVLVTSTRNQAIDAVTLKVSSFGALVFGNKKRLGQTASEYTIDGHLKRDLELRFWRNVVASWDKAFKGVQRVLWTEKKFHAYPGVKRLLALQKAADGLSTQGKLSKAGKKSVRAGKTAGRWILALRTVMQEQFERRLQLGNKNQRRTLRRLKFLDKMVPFLETGRGKATKLLLRLEDLTRHRIFTEARVLLCTVDSIPRMARDMDDGLKPPLKKRGKKTRRKSNKEVKVDTAIMDEAGCALEPTIPMILALGVNNLTLVGDHHQLPPFSAVPAEEGVQNHSRSFMKRALDAGLTSHFLDTQYRMHPRICEVVSKCFYEGRLMTAATTISSRRARKPCKWIDVRGEETQHLDKGFSNTREVTVVVQEARAARRRYGAASDVRVVTFYRKQLDALKTRLAKVPELKELPVLTVDACQGSEADVIILSTVRSKGHPSSFMRDQHRLNVAFSRAREECIVVGNKSTFQRQGGGVWRSIVGHYTS